MYQIPEDDQIDMDISSDTMHDNAIYDPSLTCSDPTVYMVLNGTVTFTLHQQKFSGMTLNSPFSIHPFFF